MVCDLTYLKELSNGKVEFEKEMIQMFLEEIPGEILNLEHGIKAKDYETVKLTTHKLKSTLPFVGLNFIVGKEVLEMEALAKSQSGLEKIEVLFLTVKEMCEKAFEELKVMR